MSERCTTCSWPIEENPRSKSGWSHQELERHPDTGKGWWEVDPGKHRARPRRARGAS